MAGNVFALAHKHAEWKQTLRQLYPDLGEDDPAFRDTLDGASDLKEAVATLLESYSDDEALARSIDERIGLLRQRKARYEHRMQQKRQAMAALLDTADETKVELAAATISLTKTAPGVSIQDPAALPPEYLRSPPPGEPKPDMKAIKAALTSGKPVPGACLDNGGMTVTIRRL
jgi:hypothetical protein